MSSRFFVPDVSLRPVATIIVQEVPPTTTTITPRSLSSHIIKIKLWARRRHGIVVVVVRSVAFDGGEVSLGTLAG